MKKILAFVSTLLFSTSVHAGAKLLHPTNVPNSTTLPATCAVGDMYMDTNATTGQRWYLCESANTWVQQGGSASGNFINNANTLQSGATAYPDFIQVGSSVSVYGRLQVGRKTGSGTGEDGTIRMFQPSVFSVIKIGGEEGQPKISFLRDDETTTEIGHLRFDSLSFYSTNPGATAIDYLAGKFTRGGLLVGNDDSLYLGSPKLLVQGNIQSTYGIIAETCTISGLTLSGTFRSTDSITATNNINAGDVIGSETGNYNYDGTTVTYAAPAIDTSDRIPVLNNGAISWPLAITDGARLGSTQTFSGGNDFTSTAGSTFTRVSVSSIVVTDLTASTILKTDSNKKISSVANTGADGTKFLRDDFTWAAASGGSADNMGNHVSTRSVDMSTFPIVSVSSIGFTNGAATDWSLHGTTTAMLSETFAATSGTFTFASIPLAANSTYTVTGALMFDITSGLTSGIKVLCNTPDDIARISIHLDGNGGSATAYLTDQGFFADNTPNPTAFGTYNVGEGTIHFQGIIVTGPSGGSADFGAVIISATSVWEGSHITMVKQP